MNKRIVLSTTLIGLLMMSGCANKGDAIVAKDAPAQYSMEFDAAPDWVQNPVATNGMLCSLGSAKVGPAGMGFAVNEATANGRDDLARQIKVNVSNMMKNFTQQTGVDDAAVVDKVVADVSKQLTQQELVGSKQTQKWVSKTGTVWVLVTMQDTSKLSTTIKDTIKSSFKNDEALWQQFQAKKAQDELDASLAKFDSK